jgi:para-nitrobenzyl esterase
MIGRIWELTMKPSTLLLLAIQLPLLALNDPVTISTGKIAGIKGNNPEVRVYKGIPYAAAPVGDLRWKPPKAAKGWSGVREAKEFGANCMQQPYAQGSLYYQPMTTVSEDCLYLNVWTAAKSEKEKRPVMVWIHGGALTRGSGSTPTYDGEAFAAKGVVLVTINYRLGLFGFMAHPELTKESDRGSSGNYGILDQIAALEWVQKNIKAFGGDPGRVTIFGESAGSWSVNCLMATPLANGLFHRAIGESGGSFGDSLRLADAEKAGEKLAASVGAKSIADLRAKSAEDLLKLDTGARPNVDGWMLPAPIATIFANGQHNDVPLIVGSNADEGTAFVPASMKQSPEQFKAAAERRFGPEAADYLKIYPASNDAEVRSSMLAAFRDERFSWQMRTWARLASTKGSSKAYLYFFKRVPPGPQANVYGAFHASEIAYVFGNLAPSRPWEEADRKLSAAMQQYWINFATSGDPNGKGLPKWPAYDKSRDEHMEFGDTVVVGKELLKPSLDFYDRFYAKQRGTK